MCTSFYQNQEEVCTDETCKVHLTTRVWYWETLLCTCYRPLRPCSKCPMLVAMAMEWWYWLKLQPMNHAYLEIFWSTANFISKNPESQFFSLTRFHQPLCEKRFWDFVVLPSSHPSYSTVSLKNSKVTSSKSLKISGHHNTVRNTRINNANITIYYNHDSV